LRLRRRPFAEVIERQLDLFARDHAGLLADCDAALRAYDDATAENAEERYGGYVDLIEAVRDDLERLRDGYASTLDDETAERYEAAFGLEARRRYPRYALDLD
jgi:hypothetical protein